MLMRDPAAPAPKAKPVESAAARTPWSANESRTASAVSVKQSITPFWDTRIGADMTVARQGTATTSELLSEKLANGGSLPQSSGTAWAAITAPGVGSIWDQTAVEVRVDPGSEQSRLGTSLSKSLPLSEQYSVTLKNDYNLIQQGIVPVPGIVSHPTRSYETDQSARLSIADTGTSLIAGQTLSTSDDKWLRKVAPSRSCSTASPSPARSAKRRPAPHRASAQGSNAAGKAQLSRFDAFSGRKITIPENDQHCRRLAQMRPKSAGQMGTLHFVVRGRPRSPESETEELPMNATIRPEQIDETPEADGDLAAVSEVEAGIRDFVRNDIAYLRRPALAPDTAPLDANAEATVNNVNSLIQRVAGTSLAEIEKLISELESLRDLLHAEGQRVQREISGYAQLSQAAMKSTRMISDNVTQWKRAADGLRNS
jgi:hypothetical protein